MHTKFQAIALRFLLSLEGFLKRKGSKSIALEKPWFMSTFELKKKKKRKCYEEYIAIYSVNEVCGASNPKISSEHWQMTRSRYHPFAPFSSFPCPSPCFLLPQTGLYI